MFFHQMQLFGLRENVRITPADYVTFHRSKARNANWVMGRNPTRRSDSTYGRMTPPVNVQFLRFLAVGALNALFGYACFATLVFVGLDYAIAVLVATVAGVLFNFETTGRVVFGNRDKRLVLRFAGVYSLTYIVNVLSLRALIGWGGLNAYLAGGICVLPLAAMSYMLLRRFVFRSA
jgi:putative flippase GtrA